VPILRARKGLGCARDAPLRGARCIAGGWDRAAGPTRLNANSLKVLEFERIRTLLLQQAGSVEGQVRLQALRPHTDPAAVREALARTSEGVALLRAVGRQPYHDLPNPAEALAAARVRGTHLDTRTLADLASFIEGGVEICRRVARVEATPHLAGLASAVQDTSDVALAIRRALLPSGEVADDASPRLAARSSA
jgi:DNA mismatch repair protein MutS2